MQKKFSSLAVLALTFALLSCGGGKEKETAASVAQKWCALNEKAYKAEEGPAKAAAEEARDTFEKEIEAKYKNDEKFMKEVETEVEKCEDASEGRK